MKFDIWTEGYLATGMEGIPARAKLVAKDVEGKTFDDAVKNWVASQDPQELEDSWGDYSFYEGKHFLWGCQLFPTEEEARKSFG